MLTSNKHGVCKWLLTVVSNNFWFTGVIDTPLRVHSGVMKFKTWQVTK